MARQRRQRQGFRPPIPALGWFFARNGPLPTAACRATWIWDCTAEATTLGRFLSPCRPNLLAALDAGLRRQTDKLLARINEDGRWLRGQLRNPRLQTRGIGNGQHRKRLPPSPCPKSKLDSEQLGNALESQGFYTSYASGYLRERNWLQICLMGEVERPQLERPDARAGGAGRRDDQGADAEVARCIG